MISLGIIRRHSCYHLIDILCGELISIYEGMCIILIRVAAELLCAWRGIRVRDGIGRGKDLLMHSICCCRK